MSRRRGSRRSCTAVGALAMVVIATFGAPAAARGAAPPAGDTAAALPVFTCRIPHAVASSALGVFATSLTLWTQVTDADAAHVAAVLWLEPPLVGAVYGFDVAATSPVETAGSAED